MKPLLIALFVLFAAPTHAFTCEDVLYAKAHWSQLAINAAAAIATQDQKQQAVDCLKKGGGAHAVSGTAPNVAQPQSAPVKKVRKTKKIKQAAAPLPEPHNPVTHSSVRIEPTVNPPVAVSAPALPQEKPMLPSWVIVVFAVAGAFSFTFMVGKYGIVPVVNKVVSWWNSGKADIVALENRVKALEAYVFPASTSVAVAKVVAPTGTTGSG